MSIPKPISQLTTGTVKATDKYPAVDITDQTQSLYGTTKEYSIADLSLFIGGGGIPITLTGAVTGSGLSVIDTILSDVGDNVISNANLAQAPATTFKANNTNAIADVTDITVTEAWTMLGIVPDANLPNIPVANLPLGTMFNLHQSQLTTSVAFTTTNFAIVDGLQVSITPTSANNKILVRAVISVGSDGTTNAYYKLNNSINDIGVGTSTGSRNPIGAADFAFGAASLSTLVMEWLDSPNTTSTLSYNVQCMQNGSGTGYINRTGTDTNTIAYPRSVSTLTVCEVVA